MMPAPSPTKRCKSSCSAREANALQEGFHNIGSAPAVRKDTQGRKPP